MKIELNAETPSSAKQSQMWLKLEGWTLNNNNTIQIKQVVSKISPRKAGACVWVQVCEHYIPFKMIWGSVWAHATSHETSRRNEKGVLASCSVEQHWESAKGGICSSCGKTCLFLLQVCVCMCVHTCKLNKRALAFVETDKLSVESHCLCGKWSLNS